MTRFINWMKNPPKSLILTIFGILVLLSVSLLFLRSVTVPVFKDPYSKVLLDEDGNLMGAIVATDEQWRFPPESMVPDKFARSIICSEDKRFYYHPGVDFFAMVRAIWQAIRSQKIVSGASTLSMQVIRLSRKNQRRTILEKCIEIFKTVRLEILFTKREILNLYAAHAPFGGNVVGLSAASWRYFGRNSNQLSWAENAMLAVLPNSPSLIHPGKNRNKLKKKRDRLLKKMKDHGIIDALSLKLSLSEPIPPKPYPIPMHAPHLLFGKSTVSSVRDGEKIKGREKNKSLRTTLKKSLQIRTNTIVNQHIKILSGNGIHNASVVILDNETANPVVYVGNINNLSDKKHENYVDVAIAHRSTGSILKPILYAAMLDAGELLPSQLVVDIPTRMGGFRPQNYTKDYTGAVPAFMALARSLNIPAVRMLSVYGVDRFYSLLKVLNMNTLHRKSGDYGLTLILGGAEGTLLEITRIYSEMARNVTRSSQSMLMEAALNSRSELEEKEDTPSVSQMRFPISPAACWLTFQAMLQVTRPGVDSSWRSFTSSDKIAWKTGTSYGHRDAWAIGVTSQYTVGVWVGNADGEGRADLSGIKSAAPILFDIYRVLGEQDWFQRPDQGLVRVDVCAKSGYRTGPSCGETRPIWITHKGLRTRSCPFCRTIHCDDKENYRVHGDCDLLENMSSKKWFVLPPVMEWYYKKKHSDYKPLPPFRADCLDQITGYKNSSLSLIYPELRGNIYIPVELGGSRGEVVFEATHRDPEATIFWHLDQDYLGKTKEIHLMNLSPSPGKRKLTLLDEKGSELVRWFTVLSK